MTQAEKEIIRKIWEVRSLSREIAGLQWKLSFYNKNIKPLTEKESIELARLYQWFYLKASEVDKGIFEKQNEWVKTFEEDPSEWYIFKKEFIKNNIV